MPWVSSWQPLHSEFAMVGTRKKNMMAYFSHASAMDQGSALYRFGAVPPVWLVNKALR